MMRGAGIIKVATCQKSNITRKFYLKHLPSISSFGNVTRNTFHINFSGQFRKNSNEAKDSAEERQTEKPVDETVAETPTESEEVIQEQEPSELDKIKVEMDETRKKLLLAYAEMENVRAIARRDVQNSKTYAVQGFAKGLLDVADNLTRAIESVPAEVKDKEKNPHLMTLLEGIEMTQNQLFKVFTTNNLNQFGAVGEPFDATLHDALFEYEDSSKTPGTIGQLLKSGYKLHDRVIRHAQVGTIKSSAPKVSEGC